MSVEDQFDVAAQDRRADAAKKARTAPTYDRDAGIAAADAVEQERIQADLFAKAKALETLADQIEADALKAEAEVPEVPGKVDQEPELTQDPQVAPPDPAAPKPEGP